MMIFLSLPQASPAPAPLPKVSLPSGKPHSSVLFKRLAPAKCIIGSSGLSPDADEMLRRHMADREIEIPPRKPRRGRAHKYFREYDTDEDLLEQIGMTRAELNKLYEEKYGPPFQIEKMEEGTLEEVEQEEEEGGSRRGRPSITADLRRGKRQVRVAKDNLLETVVEIRRTTKVVKGGKNVSYRVLSVVGDRKGRVGIGLGKAKEVPKAIAKSVLKARKNSIVVKMDKYKTIPHETTGHFHAADVKLWPARPGRGLLIGGAPRAIMEMAGVENVRGKQFGSDNRINNARATFHAISKLMSWEDWEEKWGEPKEERWKWIYKRGRHAPRYNWMVV